MMNLKYPSVSLVREKLDKMEQSGDEPRRSSSEINYPAIKNAEKALKKLIDCFPGHKNLDEIYLKVTAVNSLYSTNIYDTYRIAYHLYSNVRDIDYRLDMGDSLLVEEIAKGHGIKGKNGNEKHFYSFATKYCSFHNSSMFAIYDTLIQELLIKFHNEEVTNENKLNYDKLREYKEFLKVIGKFKERFELKDFSLKEVDMYLWLLGKERELSKLSKNKDL
jgi:hypothetical protein